MGRLLVLWNDFYFIYLLFFSFPPPQLCRTVASEHSLHLALIGIMDRQADKHEKFLHFVFANIMNKRDDILSNLVSTSCSTDHANIYRDVQRDLPSGITAIASPPSTQAQYSSKKRKHPGNEQEQDWYVHSLLLTTNESLFSLCPVYIYKYI